MLDRVLALFIDLEEHVHDRFIRAAVQRTLESADGAGYGGVDIGKRRSDDARGKGGRVELMVCMQDERDVHGAGCGFPRASRR